MRDQARGKRRSPGSGDHQTRWSDPWSGCHRSRDPPPWARPRRHTRWRCVPPADAWWGWQPVL